MDKFGYRDAKMYNSYETLQYGQSHRYAFNGTYRMDERGLLVDSFAGCIYNQDMDATLRMNISFTNAIVYTSGGTSLEEVTGVQDGMLSVPTKIEEYGSVSDENTGEKKLVNSSSNIFWFKGEPEFELNTFKLKIPSTEDQDGKHFSDMDKKNNDTVVTRIKNIGKPKKSKNIDVRTPYGQTTLRVKTERDKYCCKNRSGVYGENIPTIK
ncbi:hypothetical protein AVEN_12533-1 [Araneus ventricosus]|uniref:Uncharacterized protein n=2 Tax=Araneus ventricosus TaxID=182803 RepID=A0A4Y2C150_ARAVE|nr:hypothetical protein AVEN_12533-1 [Araneus ventricosus]